MKTIFKLLKICFITIISISLNINASQSSVSSSQLTPLASSFAEATADKTVGTAAGVGSHSSAAAAIIASASSSAMPAQSSDLAKNRLKRACPESHALSSKKSKVDIHAKEQSDKKTVKENTEATEKLIFVLSSENFSTNVASVRHWLSMGANVNAQDRVGTKLLGLARTVEMAELMVKYGADETLKTHGQDCLRYAISHDSCDPSLVSWYITQGVSITGSSTNPLFLLHDALLFSDCEELPYGMRFFSTRSETKEIVTYLINAGARLDVCCTYRECHGLNVPQYLKEKIDFRIEKNMNAKRLQKIRNLLMSASGERRNAHFLKEYLHTYLLPQLCEMVTNYYVTQVENEPSYEELEAMPMPQSRIPAMDSSSPFYEKGVLI